MSAYDRGYAIAQDGTYTPEEACPFQPGTVNYEQWNAGFEAWYAFEAHMDEINALDLL